MPVCLALQYSRKRLSRPVHACWVDGQSIFGSCRMKSGVRPERFTIVLTLYVTPLLSKYSASSPLVVAASLGPQGASSRRPSIAAFPFRLVSVWRVHHHCSPGESAGPTPSQYLAPVGQLPSDVSYPELDNSLLAQEPSLLPQAVYIEIFSISVT